MYIYECYRLHNLSKQSVDVIVRFNEEKRRKMYSKRYFNIAITSLSLAIVPIIALCVTLPPKNCLAKQSLLFNTVCTDCQLDGCADCSTTSFNKCGTCDAGLFYDAKVNRCSDCDDYEGSVICKECKGLN